MNSGSGAGERRAIFSFHHPMALGLPKLIQFVMFVAFGMPAVACILFTMHDLPENPWLIFVYMVSCFPLSLLFVLAWLMSRYGLFVFENGDVELKYPFARMIIRREQLASVVSETQYVHVTKSRMTWFRFVDHDGRVITSLARNAFPHPVFVDFFAALRSVSPNVKIEVNQ